MKQLEKTAALLPPSASDRLRRIQVVDLVRSFSILVVLATHLNTTNILDYRDSLGDRLWPSFAGGGSYGVTLFFVISGFLITRTTAAREADLFKLSLPDFYLRRLARILPLLLLIVAFGALMLWLPRSQALDFCFRDPNARFDGPFWLSLLLPSLNWLRMLREPHPMFGLHWDVLWSLAIELQFYLLFPLFLRATGNLRNLKRLLWVMIILGPVSRSIAYLIAPESFNIGFFSSFASFELLALGIFLHLSLEDRGPQLRQDPALSGFLCLLGAALIGMVYVNTSLGNGIHRIYGPSLLGLGCFSFLLGGLQLKGFNSQFAAWLAIPGKLSYEMYLLHAGALFFLWPFLAGKRVLVAFALLVLVTIGLAYLVSEAIGKPSERWLKRLSGLSSR